MKKPKPQLYRCPNWRNCIGYVKCYHRDPHRKDQTCEDGHDDCFPCEPVCSGKRKCLTNKCPTCGSTKNENGFIRHYMGCPG